MFSSFFKCPLLNASAIERELNAVESEFELNSKDDDTRLSQLMSFTCGMDADAPIMGREWHPMKNDDDEGRRVEEAGAGGEPNAKERPFHPFAKVRCSSIVVGYHVLVSSSITIISKNSSHVSRLLPFSHSSPDAKLSFHGGICHR
jgi:hypothetical protein